MRTRHVLTTVAASGAALLALSACTATPAAGPSSAPTSDQPVAAAGCIAGDWHLDTDDLVAQLERLVSATTDISDVDTEGDEKLTFADGGDVSIVADLDITATVAGVPGTRSVHTSGSGQWSWVEEGSVLRVSDWTWDDAGTSSEPNLPMFDLTDSGDIAVACTADELTLTPTATPVTGRFER